ncbi:MULTISPECIES: replicative DNA helicase [Streptomyces]|uniref:DNA helicase n=1 Tax=Streptomyces fradiae ATCC 10745 = DSM 40063 TaxID=1319510 RepID=A0A1Y2NSE9_STRFR|nr:MULTISPECIES: replicative DNA helicase [Streptomyces]KAF0651170.1 DNA helicase [Streptomyces fradiae ATCC 10745 = DSM 40063]OSY50414.1 Replicative DNA helicase [Streptomyces fradiae ATCC 10745 = DSM 40063]
MSTDLWDAPLDETPAGPSVIADLDAERILAATVMARPSQVDELYADGFDPADFTDDRYRWVWYAVEHLAPHFRDGEIRYLAVDRQLQAWRADGRMPTIPLTLDQLTDLYNHAQPGSASWHAQQISRTAVARRLEAHGHTCITRARSAAFDADADISAAQTELDGVVRATDSDDGALVGDLLAGVLERAVTPPTLDDRIPTGFIDLDELMSGGWAPGQLVVVGARPAMGKTTFALGLARAAAIKNNIPTLFESLEMGKDELSNSIVCAEAQVALHHVKQGSLGDDPAAVARLAKNAQRIQPAPLHIYDGANLSVAALRARVRNLVRTAGLRLVVVDYLQLMQAPKAESRQVAVSELSRQLKLLAKEFGITVVVLAQLNRGPEQRTDKKPMVSDLRESGSIEQDADIVILLHREDAYEKESPRAGEADLIVGKHRNGPTGTITVAFQGHYARFVDMAIA